MCPEILLVSSNPEIDGKYHDCGLIIMMMGLLSILESVTHLTLCQLFLCKEALTPQKIKPKASRDSKDLKP